MENFKIQRADPEQLLAVLQHHMPKGSFLTWEDTVWVTVDNTTGEAWTEEFLSENHAVRWLCRQFEVYH